ncbi:MAG: hypothetical protein LC623_02585 [Halobacteriales archaeon]|nr:hypothetical protein [Halobacteriales archaeon]
MQRFFPGLTLCVLLISSTVVADPLPSPDDVPGIMDALTAFAHAQIDAATGQFYNQTGTNATEPAPAAILLCYLDHTSPCGLCVVSSRVFDPWVFDVPGTVQPEPWAKSVTFQYLGEKRYANGMADLGTWTHTIQVVEKLECP